MTYTDWRKPYQEVIEDCRKRDERINDWERGFLDSIERRLAENEPLTDRQTEKLDDIWAKATARG